MAEIKWYKRDPDAALAGMMQLTLEERGAYNTVLDLIYSKADNLRDDDRMIAGFLSCDPRVWKRIKAKLVDLGKLRIEDGFIRNLRATSEILTALHRVASASEAGRASAAARAAKSKPEPKQNKDIRSTPAERPVERPLQLSTTTTTSRIESPSSSASGSADAGRGLEALETKLREAAGWQSEPHPGLFVTGPIAAVIAAGASLDLDVLPVVKAMAPRVNGRTGWKYFIGPIRDAMAARLKAGAPVAAVTDSEQRKRDAARLLAEHNAKVANG